MQITNSREGFNKAGCYSRHNNKQPGYRDTAKRNINRANAPAQTQQPTHQTNDPTQPGA
ncbi:hypothetical protein AZ036_004408 [Klebsiella michiganensis]|nr:hypothetical protein AZ036_004408 [Klebsiella michiganensis]